MITRQQTQVLLKVLLIGHVSSLATQNWTLLVMLGSPHLLKELTRGGQSLEILYSCSQSQRGGCCMDYVTNFVTINRDDAFFLGLALVPHKGLLDTINVFPFTLARPLRVS